MNIPLVQEIATLLIKRWEGLYLHPYLCPAGIPTIGYGATYYKDGRSVSLKDAPITKEEAEQLLLWMVETKYLPEVMKLCPAINTPERFAALIDFAFNLGSSRLKVSTLRKKVNTSCWEAVPKELLKWNKAGGRVLKGLQLRREAEAKLI